MKTKSPEREKARKLYLKSDKTAKNKEIAEKLGVSVSLVAKWKSQDKWDSEDLPKEKVKSKGKNKSKGKPGAPFGNHNAFANRGGPPLGSVNALKHGGYSQVYWDTIDEAERAMIQDMPEDEETMLLDQIKLFSVRERRIMQAIEKVKGGDEEAKLDIIANAISYTHLMERHIDKEDRVVYTFAERNLKENILDEINSECLKFEDDNETVKNKYLEVLSKLEAKYIM